MEFDYGNYFEGWFSILAYYDYYSVLYNIIVVTEITPFSMRNAL